MHQRQMPMAFGQLPQHLNRGILAPGAAQRLGPAHLGGMERRIVTRNRVINLGRQFITLKIFQQLGGQQKRIGVIRSQPHRHPRIQAACILPAPRSSAPWRWSNTPRPDHRSDCAPKRNGTVSPASSFERRASRLGSTETPKALQDQVQRFLVPLQLAQHLGIGHDTAPRQPQRGTRLRPKRYAPRPRNPQPTPAPAPCDKTRRPRPPGSTTPCRKPQAPRSCGHRPTSAQDLARPSNNGPTVCPSSRSVNKLVPGVFTRAALPKQDHAGQLAFDPPAV